MRITHITIANMAAFAAFDADLPAVCLIEGQNGVGKTSLLNCIRYAFGRGHDGDIIHGDAESGEIVLTFDDGSQVKARASRKSNETTRGWKAPGAKKFTVTREQIDAIAKAISYDPLAFMGKTEAQQLQILMEIMPVEVDIDAMVLAIGDATAEAAGAAVEGKNGLETIAAVSKSIYDARTGYNTAADTQEKHAATLEAALPPPAPGENWTAEVKRLEAQKAAAEKVERDDIWALGNSFHSAKEGATAKSLAEQSVIESEVNQKVLELERQIAEAKRVGDRRKNEIQIKALAAIEAARKIANEETARIKAEAKPKIEAVATLLATAQERARAHQQAEGTRKAIDVAKQEAMAQRARSTRMTASLKRLADLKEKVAATLPISGIEIADGRILNNQGVPFAKWNTEAQIMFCLRVAVLAHGKAGFICLDEAGRVVGNKFEGLIRTAKKYAESEAGLQFIISVAVPGKPLQISEP